ncbi:hypothetical protein FQN52_001121 [Onygenales sp. PD_12]|nr:hypothetical protein FQN52_001121 [Onygenales sp. PD_12]
MAAPRSTSLRALRLLAQEHAPPPTALATMAPFRRSLHITSAFSAQPARGPDVTSIYRSRSLGDLRAECERRNLRAGGSKSELVDRLSNHDVLQSRAFSIAMRKIDSRPVNTGSPSRNFNTSRAAKAVNDTSTIDFAYMPRESELFPASPTNGAPIPILPDSYAHYQLSEAHPQSPMKPEIYTVGDPEGFTGTAASAMSEVVDNLTVDFDPFELTETVSRARAAEAHKQGELAEPSGETVKGAAKQFWSGIVEDLTGSSGEGKGLRK